MQCDDDDTSYNCQDNVLYLAELKSTIESMANASVCNDDFECRFIAFGSKPCGGPWEFLVYSASIDSMALVTAVTEYNQLEADYNLNCNVISDCSTPQPPTSFSCDNNQCIPIF